MYRPACRMNQTGGASTGCRRQALMNRVARSVSVHLEQGTGEVDQILQPHRLEQQCRAQLANLVRHRIVEEVIAGDDRNGRLALFVQCTEAAEEPESVD